MRIEKVNPSYDSMKQHVYYAGTHLVNYYPYYYSKNNSNFQNESMDDSNLFNSPFDYEIMAVRERDFLQKRIEHQNREELLQRLNYITGVHFSQSNRIISNEA